MNQPQPLGRLLPDLVADLARRHGIQPPATLTDRTPMTADMLVAGPGTLPGEGLCDFCEELGHIAVRGSGLAVCEDCAALAEPGDGAA